MNASSDAPTPPRHRVLVIDDSEDIHRDFRKVLAAQAIDEARQPLSDAETSLFGRSSQSTSYGNFDLDCAHQGELGAQMVRRAIEEGDPYGCIFVDMRMPPGWDGFQTAQEIWAIDPEAQLVICSAYSDYSWEEFTVRLGHTDKMLVLKKPFEAIEVSQMAASLCAKRALLSERAEQVKRLVQAERLSAMGQVAAGVAHDFNNILTSILNFTAFVQSNLDADDPHREDLEEVLLAAQTAAGLTDELQCYAKPQPRFDAHHTFDLNALVLSARRLIEDLLGELIELDLRLSKGTAPVHGDPNQIKHLIVNMAANAGEAMPQGGTLSISTTKTLSETTISLSDTGCGMPPEVLAQVFEPFFTTKETGTGLGLSTAYSIIQHHGGAIDTRSAPNEGTTFRITFPHTTPHQPHSSPEPRPTHTGDQPHSVLVVDDKPGIRRLCVRILSKEGFTVTEAADGAEALQHLRDKPVDLLITDLLMPRMTGRDLSEKALGLDARLRVLFMSGYADGLLDNRHEARDTRSGFISKPFLPEVLIESVHRLLSAKPPE